MKKASGNSIKQLTVSLLIIVMAALMINRVVYTHIHVLPNGSVIAHAHPFSKSTEGNPNSSHQHSNTQLFLLDHLDILMLFVCTGFVLKQVSMSTDLIEPVTDFLLPAFVPHSQGRAPPSCM